jgi:L-fuconolactonase
MIFDSHAHLISDDVARYPPDPMSGQLRAGDLDDPMTAERLLRQMDLCGVERAVCVQRSHVYGFDNSYVCDAAAAHPGRLSAVCSVDGRADDCGEQVRRWVDRGAVGVRMMEPFKGADASWFAGDVARPVWETAAALGSTVCVHFFRWNREVGLPALAKVLRDFPSLPVVVDHFSNMASETGPPDHGIDALLEAVAVFPQVRTKFTTLPLGQLDEQKIDAAPVVRRVVDLFGAERVMWGSDIAQSKGGYGYMVDLGLAAARLLSESEQRQVLYGAADAVYGARARVRA